MTFYGYAYGGRFAHILVNPEDAQGRCGEYRLSLVSNQLTREVCGKCAALTGPKQPRPVRGECPECGGDVPLDRHGWVKGHRQWRVGVDGPYRSGFRCTGSGPAVKP